jgi:ATP/maltotriose-dependent transcriptional regulator MalT
MVVLVTGEPGIGKSRLLDEFPAIAGSDDVMVLRGGAIDAEGMPPYLPFLDVLRELVAGTPLDALHGDLGGNAPVLARLVPDMAAYLGDLPPLESLGADHDRLRLFDAIAAVFQTIAARGALLLILDDLQWADSATCDLLVHVARRCASSPLLIAGACREGEADDNPAVVRALAELNRRRLLVTLPLRRLAEGDTGRLAASVLRGAVDPPLVAYVQQHSDGNPFFVEELLRALVAEGQVVQRCGTWSLTAEPALLLPEGVAAAIRMRLQRIDPAAVELLEIAAVIGRVWDVDVLAAVAGCDVEQVEAGLIPAARAKMIRPEPDEVYAFTHDKIRETLYAGITGTRRRRLHLAIGNALEGQDDDWTDRRVADLAFHFVRAGDRRRGASYAIAAGDDALGNHAWVEAVARFQSAVELLRDDGDRAEIAAALTGLGEAATLSGDYQRAAASYLRLVHDAMRRGDALEAARAWARLGELHWRQEAVDDTREAFARALNLLGTDDSVDRARTLLRFAELLSVSFSEYDASIAMADEALAIVQRLGARELEAATLSVLGNVRARHGDTVAGREMLEEALSLALGRNELAQACQTCAYLTPVCGWLGELARAWEVTHVHERLAMQLSDRFQLRYVFLWRGIIHAAKGDWDASDAWFDQASAVIEQFGDPMARMMAQAMRSTNDYFRGRFDVALDRLQHAVGPRGERAPRPNQPWVLSMLGRTLIEVGRRDEALVCLAALEELANRPDAGSAERSVAYSNIVAIGVQLNERQRAAAMYDRLLPFRGQMHGMTTPVDRALGLAAACAGDVPAALRHLADAEAFERRQGLRPKLAMTLLYRGLIEQQLGGAHLIRGRACVEEGLHLADELSMQELAQRIVAVAGPAASPRPNGLSERQLEVLRLVAQGMTNREIAAALSISMGTVANHLTAIFTKAGVDNRAGAVAFAHRHGLAEA